MPNTVINRRLMSGGRMDPWVTFYVNTVLPSIGAAPLSRAQVVNMSKMMKQFRSAGIDPGAPGITGTHIKELNCYPSSTTLTINGTPLVLGPTGADSGSYQWSNRGGNLVDGDCTINGVAGDASAKAFVTGIRPSGTYASADNAGIAVYVSTMTASGYDVGGYGTSGVNPLQSIGANVSGNFRADCWDNIGISSITNASPNAGGFYAQNRISATDFRTYFSNTTNAFAQQAVNTNASAQTWFGGAGNNNLIVMGIEFAGTLQVPTARRQSFFVAYSNMTAALLSSMSDIIHGYLFRKGGGFV